MDEPARADFSAARHAPVREPIIVRGLDLTGATFHAQVRLSAGTGGTALLDLATVPTAGAQGLRFVDVDTTGPYPVSRIEMCIDQAAMEALPNGSVRDQPATLAWDLIVTPSGGTAFRLLAGSFIVYPGVAQ